MGLSIRIVSRITELSLGGTPVRSVVDGSVVEYWTRPIVNSGMS